SLARDHGARVILLHVYPPPISHGEVVARRQDNGYEEDLWQQLERWRSPYPEVPVEPRLAEGVAAAEILAAAREMNTDLIVMGTHGRTGLRRLLMGSVAEEVVRRASCPVLTMTTPFPQVAEAPAEPETASV